METQEQPYQRLRLVPTNLLNRQYLLCGIIQIVLGVVYIIIDSVEVHTADGKKIFNLLIDYDQFFGYWCGFMILSFMVLCTISILPFCLTFVLGATVARVYGIHSTSDYWSQKLAALAGLKAAGAALGTALAIWGLVISSSVFMQLLKSQLDSAQYDLPSVNSRRTLVNL